MTRPTGKKARLVPGKTKGVAFAAAADAEADAAAASAGVACLLKTPFTNDASFDERVALTSWPVGVFAEIWILGIRRGRSVFLLIISQALH